jgi:hypothetical protein
LKTSCTIATVCPAVVARIATTIKITSASNIFFLRGFVAPILSDTSRPGKLPRAAHVD